MKPLAIQRTAAFEEDFRLQADWYVEKAGEDIAERYLAAVAETAHRLSLQPGLGRKRHFRSHQLHGLRSMAAEGAFHKHLLFYRVEEKALVLFRVLHGMRDLPRRLLDQPGAE